MNCINYEGYYCNPAHIAQLNDLPCHEDSRDTYNQSWSPDSDMNSGHPSESFSLGVRKRKLLDQDDYPDSSSPLVVPLIPSREWPSQCVPTQLNYGNVANAIGMPIDPTDFDHWPSLQLPRARSNSTTDSNSTTSYHCGTQTTAEELSPGNTTWPSRYNTYDTGTMGSGLSTYSPQDMYQAPSPPNSTVLSNSGDIGLVSAVAELARLGENLQVNNRQEMKKMNESYAPMKRG